MFYYRIVIMEKNYKHDMSLYMETRDLHNNEGIRNILREHYLDLDIITEEEIKRIVDIHQVNRKDYEDAQNRNSSLPPVPAQLVHFEVGQEFTLAQDTHITASGLSPLHPKGTPFSIVSPPYILLRKNLYLVRFAREHFPGLEPTIDIPVDHQTLIEWISPSAGRQKKPNRIDTAVRQIQYPGHPAVYQQIVNVQTDEVVPFEAIKGARVLELFTASHGELITSYELAT